MKKILYTLIITFGIGGYVFAQCGGSGEPDCNPGYFEVRLNILSQAQVELQMRAVSSVVPAQSTCGGFPPAIQNNIVSDLTFAIQWPLGEPVLGLVPQTVAPCACSGGVCSGGGYNIGLGGDVFDGQFMTIQPFAATGTPYGINMNWVLNDWVTICTLDVYYEGDPLDVPFEVYAHGDDENAEISNSIVPNFNFDATDYTMAVNMVLPLDLLTFDAEKYGERSAVLNWTTANEVNVSHFVVERSTDRYTWEEVGKVEATGDHASATQRYQFIDQGVYDGRRPNARYYYRLDVVDNDGRAKKSNIDVVQFSNSLSAASVYIFPNPSTDGVNVELNYSENSAMPAEILMYNDLGQMVYSQQVPENSSIEFIDFSKTNIASGTYTVQVLDDVNGILSTDKLVVQR